MAAGSSGRLEAKTNLSDCWTEFLKAKEQIGPGLKDCMKYQQAAAELQEEETDSQQHAVETLTEGGQEKQKAQLRTAELLAGGVPCWETGRDHSKVLFVSDRYLGRRVCFQTLTFRIMFAPP